MDNSCILFKGRTYIDTDNVRRRFKDFLIGGLIIDASESQKAGEYDITIDGHLWFLYPHVAKRFKRIAASNIDIDVENEFLKSMGISYITIKSFKPRDKKLKKFMHRKKGENFVIQAVTNRAKERRTIKLSKESNLTLKGRRYVDPKKVLRKFADFPLGPVRITISEKKYTSDFETLGEIKYSGEYDITIVGKKLFLPVTRVRTLRNIAASNIDVDVLNDQFQSLCISYIIIKSFELNDKEHFTIQAVTDRPAILTII